MSITINKPNRCVMARIMRQKIMYKKDFYFSKYPTRSAAVKAATRWLKKLESVLPPPMSAVNRMTSRNKSGVVGVNYSRHTLKRGRKRYVSRRWVAQWPGCRLSGGLTWSLRLYGANDAFVLAVLSRKMETVDRDKIIKKLDAIKGTKNYQKLLALRKKTR